MAYTLMCHSCQQDSAMALHDVLWMLLLLVPSVRIVIGSGIDEHTLGDATGLSVTGTAQYDNATPPHPFVPQDMSTTVMNNYVQTQPMREDASGRSKQSDSDRANRVANSVLVTMKGYTLVALRATRSVTTSRYTRRVITGRRCSGRISRQAAGVKLSRSARIGIKYNQIVVPRNTRIWQNWTIWCS